MFCHAHISPVVCFHNLFIRSPSFILKVQKRNMSPKHTLISNYLYLSSCSFFSRSIDSDTITTTTTSTTSNPTRTLFKRIHRRHCHYHHHDTLYKHRLYKPLNKLDHNIVIQKRLLHTSRLDNMKFVQFLKTSNNGTKTSSLGVEAPPGEIVDLVAADPTIPSDMKTFLEESQTHLAKVSRALGTGKHRLKKEDVKLLAPITQPDKLICIGMNYRDHCLEMNTKVPVEPVIFSKFSSCIIGPYDDIPYPEETEELDWEVELAFVIGKEGKKIAAKDAMSHVFGYTVAHDVSARDWQMKKNGRQWLLGKSMDGFCPLGPSIVMKEDILDPEKLGIRSSVNGVIKQDSNTSNLVFGIENLVVYLSRFFTLKPGDVVVTGTPPGVGVFRKPPEFLKKGDVVKCEIDDIGSITNKIV